MTSDASSSTLPTAPKDHNAMINTLNAKLRQVVHDFASGDINRLQFEQLYSRYQRQLILVEQVKTAELNNNFSDTGETMRLKRSLTARVLGLTVYSNFNGLPIETMGDFCIDSSLIVPMLSSYRAATREIFKAGMRSTVMENGQWLCFVPGGCTTLIVLYTVEPSKMQLEQVEQMHRDFEQVNLVALQKSAIDPATLARPFVTFIRQFKNDR